MVGGLAGELKSGGIKVGPPAAKNDIEEEEDEGEGEEKVGKVNPNEVKKYIKLSRDSLADIYKIVGKLIV